jgi:undecaprenyl diphosphate synthase
VQSESIEPLHVAIIMDGNGRWATRRGLPRVAGHRAGVSAVRRVIEHAPDLGISALTLYAFSSDNWKRPAQEISGIFSLMRAYLRLETDRLKRNSVRLQVIGRRDRLPQLLLREIERTEHETAAVKRLRVRIAVDYSSRDAIAIAAGSAFSGFSAVPEPSLNVARRMLNQALTNDAGEVDLLIRTGGEKRLSDFLLWESAYAELFFTDCMWPDFGTTNLTEALEEFRRRQRRFGGVPADTTRAEQRAIGGAH